MDLFGLFLLVLVVVGAVLVVRQVRFTAAAQRLARRIAEEGGFERDSLARDPRGKVLPEVAAEQFTLRKAAVDADPEDWRAWFQLGVAYGDLRQPQAARAAVRRAVALERAQRR